MTSDTHSDWTVAETPVDAALRDVTQTAVGPYAVGSDGVVLGRTDDGTWEIVVPAGPATARNHLTAVDVTADGRRLWFAGSSGALGRYDTETGRKHDFTAPGEKTSTWEAVAVTGERGRERLFAANGSGEVLAATVDADGCPRFGPVVEPGRGSSITALDAGGGRVYAVDTSGNVFARPVRASADCDDAASGAAATDGGAELRSDPPAEEPDDDGAWREIGIDGAQVDFHDVAASGDRVLVAGDGGLIYRYDAVCDNWTPVQAGVGALAGIDDRDGRTVAVGTDGSAFDRRPGREGWGWAPVPTEDGLGAVALGAFDVAVGEGGAVLERGVDS
ncbi:hypothetical protein [Halosimplex pelagicum]|uniref:WD40 repeat domain-containing protein n=1 Tax=Halosimplex pelagicum TaxID=869886 RepID=A0A7D5SXK9_9EURY|nr:hypothetical protein [Halosimplex pelagicum]QLH84027.1 hypothetical protein HZS54_21345 [Halosimplex pelagicum]